MAIDERTTAPDRRTVFKQIAATLGGGMIAAAALQAASPIRQAIAEYQAAAEAHDKAEDAADNALWAAFPEPKEPPESEDQYPAEIRQLYAESKRRYRVMDAAYTRIMNMRCTSLADCIAALEWGADDETIAIDMALPCLRKLASAA